MEGLVCCNQNPVVQCTGEHDEKCFILAGNKLVYLVISLKNLLITCLKIAKTDSNTRHKDLNTLLHRLFAVRSQLRVVHTQIVEHVTL